MNRFNEISGEEGLFEIRKMKLLYEVIPLEKGFLWKKIRYKRNKSKGEQEK